MRIVTLLENSAFREDLSCEHGLSLYIETCGKKILFDAGQSGTFACNAEKLGIDLAGVELAVLSHGHYDHGGGLAEFLKINQTAPVYLHRDAFAFDFRPRSFRVHPKPLRTMLKLGIPIAIQTSAGSISGLFVSSFINQYGVIASAVTGVGNKMNSIALIVANALNTSGSSMIGQNFGAGNISRVRSVVYHVFVFDLIFVSLISMVILNFPEQVFSLFNKDPGVLELSHVYAPVAAISFMGFAVRSPSLAFINGLGNSR